MISVTPSPRRIASHYLLTRSGLRPRPLLTLADDGTVVGVDTWRDPDRQAGVEFYPASCCRGMVNAHCHLELSCLRGAIPAGGGFAAFARGMGAQRGRFDEEQRRRGDRGGRRPHVARGRGGRGRRGQWREYVRCEGAQRDPLPIARRTFSACSPRRRPLSTGCCAMPPRRSRRIRPIPSPMRFSAEFAAGRRSAVDPFHGVAGRGGALPRRRELAAWYAERAGGAISCITARRSNGSSGASRPRAACCSSTIAV